jgi:hypothetical protein
MFFFCVPSFGGVSNGRGRGAIKSLMRLRPHCVLSKGRAAANASGV